MSSNLKLISLVETVTIPCDPASSEEARREHQMQVFIRELACIGQQLVHVLGTKGYAKRFQRVKCSRRPAEQ
jgi:hypothetical protein